MLAPGAEAETGKENKPQRWVPEGISLRYSRDVCGSKRLGSQGGGLDRGGDRWDGAAEQGGRQSSPSTLLTPHKSGDVVARPIRTLPHPGETLIPDYCTPPWAPEAGS